MNQDERNLLNRIADGERRAFQILYERHVRVIYSVCLRMTGNYEDAEEAVQDTFMSFVRLGEELRKIDNPRAWLTRVGARRATDLVRRRSRHDAARAEDRLDESGAPVVALDFLPSPGADLRDTLAQEELTGKIRELSKKLPERQFLAFTLRHFQGMSIAEVAEVMGCSEGAVKAHLHLSLKRMRDIAQADGLLDGTQNKRGRAGR